MLRRPPLASSIFLAILIAGAAAIACGQRQDRSPATAADLDSVRAAVDELNARYVRAVAEKDTAAILDLFADDAVVLVHSASPVAGRVALRGMYAGFFAAVPDAEMTIAADTVVVSEAGDLAYEIARYAVEGTAPGGIVWEDRGRYLFTLRPADGRWRIAVAAAASELPPPGAPEEDTGRPGANTH